MGSVKTRWPSLRLLWRPSKLKFITSVMRGGISGENRLSGWYRSATPVIANNMAVSGPTRGHSKYGGTDFEELALDIGIHPMDQTDAGKLAREVDLSGTRDNGLVPNQKKRRGDTPGV